MPVESGPFGVGLYLGPEERAPPHGFARSQGYKRSEWPGSEGTLFSKEEVYTELHGPHTLSD